MELKNVMKVLSKNTMNGKLSTNQSYIEEKDEIVEWFNQVANFYKKPEEKLYEIINKDENSVRLL